MEGLASSDFRSKFITKEVERNNLPEDMKKKLLMLAESSQHTMEAAKTVVLWVDDKYYLPGCQSIIKSIQSGRDDYFFIAIVRALAEIVDTSVKRQLSPISTKLDIFRTANSNARPSDPVTQVPRSDGMLPSKDGHIAFPGSLAELVIAENERLPTGGTNTWNRERSRELLRWYGQDVPGDYPSDTESGEDRPYARQRRIVLAKHLGFTASQIETAYSLTIRPYL
eukprot:m51a1_g1135 hypothetical protein (225) ;mRNA; r:228312-230219